MPDFTKRRILRESDDTGDRQSERHEWLMERRRLPDGTLPAGALARASRQKRALHHRAAELAAGRLSSSLTPAAKPKADPPGAPQVVPYWTPLGPSVVAHGQAAGNPVVSGRVTAIDAGPGGSRVYLGAANGGVWYSADSGATWAPIDEYALPPETAKLSHLEADSLSTGAIAVRFGTSAAKDEIFVGTGEPPGTFEAQYFGVGIKHSPSGGTGPAWTLEAHNLAGHGVYRIVIDPDHPEVVFAATTGGLYMRPRSAPFDNWILITNPLPGIQAAAISDLVIAGTGANKIYFAAAFGGSVYRCSNATVPGGGNWSPVGGLASASRVTLAASEGGASSVVYALDGNAALRRLDATPHGNFSPVVGVPKALFFGDQGNYDIALAVDPSNPNTVYIVGDTILADDWNLAIFKGTVTGSPGSYVFPFNPANDMTKDSKGKKDSSRVHNDPTWIGKGVHPDGHAIAFATNPDGTHDPTNVWVGCDGGVFQSKQSGVNGSFQPHNCGLAITQLTYMAQQLDTDAVLVAGAQDQGTLRFRGDQVCFEDPEGDGGGCAYDPTNGYRLIREYTNAELYTATDGGNNGDDSWTDLKDAGKFPPIGSGAAKALQTAADMESEINTAFYAPLAAVAVDATHSLLAFGTNRLWISPDWGDTWFTVPSKNNPYAGPAASMLTQDALDGEVTAIAWASPTRVFVATATSVYRFDQTGGTWAPHPPAALPVTGLPAARSITSIAVEDAAAGKIYVAIAGGNVDHVWYFDPGPNKWVSAGLAQATLDVPCHAIAVDPAHTEQIYLGTDVGVFKGVKGGAGWSWAPLGSNLPECAVTDLAIHTLTRVLRAATQGLGLWEFPLDVASVPNPDLYLRANAADSGRAPRPAFLHGLPDPTHQGTTLDLVSSPDIKILRSSHSQLEKPPDFLGFASLDNFQTDRNTYDTLGTNQIFVEVHNRGRTSVDGSKARVLLLLADGSAALPALPADFANRFQNGDTSAWLGIGWHFADPANPYRTLPATLDARTPQPVQYDVDFGSLNFFPDKIAAVAFVTTDTDPCAPAGTDANALIVSDKHVAVRRLEVGVDWRVVLGIVLLAVGIGVAIAEFA